MPDRKKLQRLAAGRIGAEFLTVDNLEDLAEHIRDRVDPNDALPVCAALARHLAEAMRTIDDLRDEVLALKAGRR
jgi:hypothetical protein